MQDMRYLNLFSKTTGVSTRFCFKYNDFIVFSVNKNLVSKAIGENGKNVKRINEILGRKIKIISNPEGLKDAKHFISEIVSPIGFKDLEMTNDEIIIVSSGIQSKAGLIGRNKRRLFELQKVIKDFFGRNLRIALDLFAIKKGFFSSGKSL